MMNQQKTFVNKSFQSDLNISMQYFPQQRQSSKIDMDQSLIIPEGTMQQLLPYNDKEILLLHLAKVLPPKNTKVQLIVRNSKDCYIASKTQQDIKSQLKAIKTFFKLFSAKRIALRKNIYLEEIIEQLEPQWQCTIFGTSAIQWTAIKLQKKYYYEIKSLTKQFFKPSQTGGQTILVVGKKNYVPKCLSKIDEILNTAKTKFQYLRQFAPPPQPKIQQNIENRNKQPMKNNQRKEQHKPYTYQEQYTLDLQQITINLGNNFFPQNNTNVQVDKNNNKKNSSNYTRRNQQYDTRERRDQRCQGRDQKTRGREQQKDNRYNRDDNRNQKREGRYERGRYQRDDRNQRGGQRGMRNDRGTRNDRGRQRQTNSYKNSDFRQNTKQGNSFWPKEHQQDKKMKNDWNSDDQDEKMSQQMRRDKANRLNIQALSLLNTGPNNYNLLVSACRMLSEALKFAKQIQDLQLKLYMNRSGVYHLLGNLEHALKDCEACFKLGINAQQKSKLNLRKANILIDFGLHEQAKTIAESRMQPYFRNVIQKLKNYQNANKISYDISHNYQADSLTYALPYQDESSQQNQNRYAYLVISWGRQTTWISVNGLYADLQQAKKKLKQTYSKLQKSTDKIFQNENQMCVMESQQYKRGKLTRLNFMLYIIIKAEHNSEKDSKKTRENGTIYCLSIKGFAPVSVDKLPWQHIAVSVQQHVRSTLKITTQQRNGNDSESSKPLKIKQENKNLELKKDFIIRLGKQYDE